MQTQRYREQHEQLKKLISEIPGSEAQVSEGPVRGVMVKFIGTLRAHLTMEDTYLYPAMMSHADAAIRAKAQAFKEEMGGLSSAVDKFYQKWSIAGAITNDRAGFVRDWSATRAALLNRMNREDSDLYELIDQKVDLRRSA